MTLRKRRKRKKTWKNSDHHDQHVTTPKLFELLAPCHHHTSTVRLEVLAAPMKERLQIFLKDHGYRWLGLGLVWSYFYFWLEIESHPLWL